MVLRIVWIWEVVWHNPTNYVFQAVLFVGMAYEWIWWLIVFEDSSLQYEEKKEPER